MTAKRLVRGRDWHGWAIREDGTGRVIAPMYDRTPGSSRQILVGGRWVRVKLVVVRPRKQVKR